jgi:hypothetical protein
MMVAAMEQLCAPTRRFREIWERGRDDDDDLFEYTEVELAVPVEEFLNYCWDWKDLRSFLIGGATPKLLWITENSFLVIDDHVNAFDLDDDIHRCIAAEIQTPSGQAQEQTLILARLYDSDMSTGEVSVFLRAVATSNSSKLTIDKDGDRAGLPSGPILLKFLRESTALQDIHLQGFHFTEEHCRALATLERTDIKMALSYCVFEPHNAEDTFIEWFRQNQVVTELVYCHIGGDIISALSWNTSVKKLVIDTNARYLIEGEEEILSLCQALRGNLGLEHLAIRGLNLSHETCRLLFKSLTMHPRMNFLSIPCYSAKAKTKGMKAIIQMLHLNTRFHTIEISDLYLSDACIDEEMYQNSILPRLEMNRNCFEVQRQAVKRADPSIRPQVLGRALHVVRYNPELVFLFLSENVPAFVWTEEEEEVEEAIPLQNDLSIVSGQKRKVSS